MGDVVELGKSIKKRVTNKEEVKRKIIHCLEQGLIEFSFAARKRMYERSLDANDIENLLRRSEILEWSQSDSGSQVDPQLIVKIRGTTTDKEEIACTIQVNNSVIILNSID